MIKVSADKSDVPLAVHIFADTFRRGLFSSLQLPSPEGRSRYRGWSWTVLLFFYASESKDSRKVMLGNDRAKSVYAWQVL